MAVDPLTATREWLDLLTSGPVEAWQGKVSEDIVIGLPFAPPGVEPQLRGRQHAATVMSGVWQSQKSFVWHDVVMRRTDDPELVVTTARSEVMLVSGQHYANSYVMFTRVRAGKIVGHIEYFNPLPIMRAFGL
jgi:ketosteroid isomerase-like protein